MTTHPIIRSREEVEADLHARGFEHVGLPPHVTDEAGAIDFATYSRAGCACCGNLWLAVVPYHSAEGGYLRW